MNRFVAVALTLCIGTLANAQTIIYGPNGPVVVPGSYQPTYPTYPTYPSQPTYPQPPVIRYPGGWVTPQTPTTIDPHTGAINSTSTQIADSVNAPGREQSRNNGTMKWVRRPVYDTYGRVKGYQQGYVWRNSWTGQEHAELNTFTPNNLGGVNNGNVIQYAPPSGINNGVELRSGINNNASQYKNDAQTQPLPNLQQGFKKLFGG